MTKIEDTLKRELAARDTEQAAAAAHAAQAFSARAAAEGLADVAYTPFDSPVGTLLLAATRRGFVHLSYDADHDATLDRLAARLSPRIVEAPARLDTVRSQLDQYFESRRKRFELELDWTLAGPFTRRVLRATAAVPYGSVATYSEIAARAGSPSGARATGNALGANPLAIVVPCHRVLRRGGALGGYGGGLPRKQFLLELEGALTPTLLTPSRDGV